VSCDHPHEAPAARAAVAAALFALLLAANLPTPLYAVYRERFGFSSVVLTLIFAVYALVLVPTVLVFGQTSDRLGRRRVIIAGLLTAMAGLVLFALAGSTAWLFAARAVQGLSVGVISGAATAALVELEPGHDRGRAALWAAVALAGGCAAGPLPRRCDGRRGSSRSW
jgi:MFS family permease